MIGLIRWKAALLFIVGLLSVGQTALAQREVLYSQYLFNPLTINPAFTGSREVLNMTAIFRRKWIGLPGLPITQSFGADGAIAGNKVGIGLQALNDRMGIYSNTGVYGSLAYRFAISPTAKLSIGASGGINVLPVFDPSTLLAYNKALPSVGVGVYYQSDQFWAGISKPELIQRPLTLASSQNAPVRYLRPLFINAGGRIDVSDDIAVLPSVLITQLADFPLGLDINAKVWLEQKLGIGLSYRANSSTLVATQSYVVALLEYQLSKSIRVGYSYSSRTVENPNLVQNSVHEIVFRYTPSPINFSYQ